MDKEEDQSYELKFRLLGNEIFAVALTTTSTSNRWTIVALATILTTMTVIGIFGDSFTHLYDWVVK